MKEIFKNIKFYAITVLSTIISIVLIVIIMYIIRIKNIIRSCCNKKMKGQDGVMINNSVTSDNDLIKNDNRNKQTNYDRIDRNKQEDKINNSLSGDEINLSEFPKKINDANSVTNLNLSSSYQGSLDKLTKNLLSQFKN